MSALPSFPGDCAWCGEPATERVHVRGRGLKRVYALACPDHARRYVPVPEPPAPPPAEKREPPLCSSCFAEITWITVVKLDGDTLTIGKRMPVDRRPLQGREPKRSLVLVNPKTVHGLVLTDAYVAAGEAQRLIDAGTHRLHFSHFYTCSSAQLHRRQNQNRAALEAA